MFNIMKYLPQSIFRWVSYGLLFQKKRLFRPRPSETVQIYSRRWMKWDFELVCYCFSMPGWPVSPLAGQPVRVGWAGERRKNTKTQIIPRRYSPRPGLHHSLLSAHSPAPALPPNTTPLSTLYPSLALSPPSLSVSPTALSLSLSHLPPTPSLAKLSEGQGVEGR